VSTLESSYRGGGEINARYQKESVRLRYQSPPQREKQCLYDLRAVCNHIGSDLNQGHYTATCYNGVNDTWYNYDDRSVKPVPETSIESEDAYILFYQRQELSDRVPDSLSAASSIGGSKEKCCRLLQKHCPQEIHAITKDDNETY